MNDKTKLCFPYLLQEILNVWMHDGFELRRYHILCQQTTTKAAMFSKTCFIKNKYVKIHSVYQVQHFKKITHLQESRDCHCDLVTYVLCYANSHRKYLV